MVSFAVAIYFGFQAMNVQMSLMIIFFLCFGAFSNIDKFEYFKFNKDGLEAKMKKLDNDLSTTKEIAKIFASLGLTTLSRSGHWGGISQAEKEKIKDELINKLQTINISDSEIKDVLSGWNEYTLLDYYISIYNEMYTMFPGANAFNKSDEYIQFENKFKIDESDVLKSRKTSKEIRDYLNNIGKMTTKLNSLLDEYEYFEINKKHKL
jgi:hypothetical protein